jgi:cell wall-associated NlpC family hydrolase
MMVPRAPHAPSRPRRSRTGVACAVAVLCLGGSALAPASAQTTVPSDNSTLLPPLVSDPSGPPPPSTTTPAPAATTPITAAATSVTTTAPPAKTTTTAAAPAAWTAKVPGPPLPTPPPPTTSPADIVLANLLETQIASQAQTLDVLAERYDRNVQAAADAAASLTQIQNRIAVAETDTSSAQAALVESLAAVRQVAVEAYVGAGASSPQLDSSILLAAYERGMAHAVTETALSKALASVKLFEQAQRQLSQVQQDLNRTRLQAVTVNDAARSAAARSQGDAQAAAQQQVQLLATVSKVTGDLAPLVAGAKAARAQAVFNRFSSQASPLDFAVTSLAAAPAQASAALQNAMAQLGKPYVWGGNGPDVFDCSGLMKWAWSHVGVDIPRVAADQQAWATPVPISQLAPGDFVFFGNPAHHVGMYVGTGQMVDAPHSGSYVEVVPIWWDQLSGFGRVHQP